MIPGLQVGDGVWFVCFGRLRRGKVLELKRSRAVLAWRTASGAERRRSVRMVLELGQCLRPPRGGFPVWGLPSAELRAQLVALEGQPVDKVLDAMPAWVRS